MRVLIVDDSATIRWDLHQILAAEGFTSELAGDVSTARKALYRQDPFDLIVLDVRLPDQDGVEFLQEIRADPRSAKVPVIMLSSEAEVPDRIRGIKTGANEFVGKPYDRGYVAARARALARMAPAQVHADRRSSTVLVIDDSASMRAKLRVALETAGYGVIVAATGEEGLRLALAFRPHALLIDGVLPGIDGRTVVQRLRMDGALRRTPCLLLTASSKPEDEKLALEAGADDFVQKGQDPEVMLARLAALMRSSAAMQDTAPSPMDPKKILAIDDSPLFLNMLTDQLTREGYALVVARTAEEALQVLKVEPVDCILLDLDLGAGMTGEAVCQQIRALPNCADTPLLVLSAADKPEMMVRMLTAGADDYVAKARDLDVLKVRLQARFRRRAVEEETRRLREQQVREELVATQARASLELAETRATLLADLEKKNKELGKARDAAVQESQFKTKFLSSMSHELRTPLNAIVGFGELMEQGIGAPLHPKQAQYVSQITQSSRHLLALVNDILDISRIESGRLTLQREFTPLSLLGEAVHASLGPVAQKRGIALDVSFPQLADVFLDPVRFRQVLYNLVWNAFKFTPKGGKVELRASIDESHLTVTVSDTGIGIPQEDMQRVFLEFEQLEFHSGREPEGTGLGLALTKRLVELHEGEITADSVVGKGTAFTVKIPLRQPGDDGIPFEADGLSRRLRDVMARADRDSRQVTLVVAKMSQASAVNNEPWQRTLLPHLGPDDFVTQAGEGTLALVAVEAMPRAASERQAWFLELLNKAMRMEVAESKAAAFPLDGRRAEELVARCLPQGAAP